jgi:hypothetical protein
VIGSEIHLTGYRMTMFDGQIVSSAAACLIHAAGSLKKDEASRLEGMRLTILMFGVVDDDRMGMVDSGQNASPTRINSGG